MIPKACENLVVSIPLQTDGSQANRYIPFLMLGSRKFCLRGSNYDGFFFLFFDEGKEDPNSTEIRPSSGRQRNAI